MLQRRAQGRQRIERAFPEIETCGAWRRDLPPRGCGSARPGQPLALVPASTMRGEGLMRVNRLIGASWRRSPAEELREIGVQPRPIPRT